MGRGVERIASAYRGLAVMLLGTLLLFVALNLAAAWALKRGVGAEEPGALTYGIETLQRVYPGHDEADIRAMIAEVATRPQVYEPFTQFQEGPVSGRFLNISEHGFRLGGGSQPWPPEPTRRNIFVFGGSTAFGYGLPDEETIPAALERSLEGTCLAGAAVYNFARPNYYSSQERTLFEQLLTRGAKPDLAVFVDGLNEFVHPEDAPKYSSRLRYLMAETGLQLTKRAIKELPVLQLLRAMSPRQDRSSRWQTAASATAAKPILERWRRNRGILQAVAAHFAVEPLFVWQPVPVYGYDLDAHPFAEDGAPLLPEHDLLATAYSLMSDSPDRSSPSFLWLGDLQRGRAEPLYVDRVHYTAAFSTEIATEIATAVIQALPCNESTETGGPTAETEAL